MLSLPPAFVLSQDQTLKFNVLRPLRGEEGAFEYPVTRLLAQQRTFTGTPSGFELATTKTSALNPKVKALTLAAAGVSLSKQTMHRAHDPGVETFNWRDHFGS